MAPRVRPAAALAGSASRVRSNQRGRARRLLEERYEAAQRRGISGSDAIPGAARVVIGQRASMAPRAFDEEQRRPWAVCVRETQEESGAV